MQIELSGSNIGIFALGRVLLKHQPKSEIIFKKEGFKKDPSDLWAEGLKSILSSITRFGRIGIMLDHHDLKGLDYFENFDLKAVEYDPRAIKRAKSAPKISLFPTSCLKHLALEGMGESVEFRRLARKCIRKAKHHRCDTLFFPERIFGEESTQKTLQHLAGTQIKVVTLADILEKQISDGKYQIAESEKQKLVFDKAFTDFELKRASEILKTKLPKNLERI